MTITLMKITPAEAANHLTKEAAEHRAIAVRFTNAHYETGAAKQVAWAERMEQLADRLLHMDGNTFSATDKERGYIESALVNSGLSLTEVDDIIKVTYETPYELPWYVQLSFGAANAAKTENL